MCLSQEEDQEDGIASRSLSEELEKLLDIHTLLKAIKALWDELPNLAGEGWESLRIRLEYRFISTVRDIIFLLTHYPRAHKRVVERGLIEKAKSGSRCIVTKVAGSEIIAPDIVPEISEEAREAFDMLFNAYRDAVKGFIKSYLSPVQRNNDLEGLVTETAEEAFKRICTYDPEKGSFYTWLIIWARIVLKRYFEEQNQCLEHEILRSELATIMDSELVTEEAAEAIRDALEVALLTNPNPQEIAELLDKFQHFLRITFSEGGYPHQQIAFGFIQLLGWTPKEIVEELSQVPLKELAKKLEDDYVRTLEYAREGARECFKPLHQRMKRRLREVIPIRDDSWEIITASPETIVGETKLKDYWGQRPEDNLSNWCYRVRQRVVRIMVKQGIDC